MPTFDAGTVVEALDWDFHAAGVKAKGTIPEPSDAQIGAFLDAVKNLYTKAKGSGLAVDTGDGNLTPEQMLDALAGVTGEAYVEFMASLAEIFATLCSDKPTKANLLALRCGCGSSSSPGSRRKWSARKPGPALGRWR